MNNWKAFLALAVMMCLVAGVVPFASMPAAAASPVPASAPVPPSWPKVIDRDGNHVIVYQPQLKSWQKYRELVADTAISITPQGGQPILGVISWKAATNANVSLRTVYVHDIEVLSSRFPGLEPAQDQAMQQRIHQIYPTMTFNISLDRMIASLQKANASIESIPVSPDVPTIFVSTVPAISLMVNGKPVLAPIDGTSIQYVVNTNWDLFYDGTNYFLLDGKTWLKSKEVAGPWTVTTKLPADMAKLPKGQNWDDVLKAIPPSAGAQAAPKVFVTEKPAEVIVFRGQPVYAPIPGTNLSYATNTQSTFFIHKPDNQLYVLISGRWFRAGSLEAPWVFAGNDLPPDFAKIPGGKSYSVALVSVPGTQSRGRCGSVSAGADHRGGESRGGGSFGEGGVRGRTTICGDHRHDDVLCNEHGGPGDPRRRRLLPVLPGNLVCVAQFGGSVEDGGFGAGDHLYDSAEFAGVQRNLRDCFESDADDGASQLLERVPGSFCAGHGDRRDGGVRDWILLSAVHLLRAALPDLLSVSLYVWMRGGL